MSKPGGIVTRSKHALHVPPPGDDGSVTSNSNRNNERPGYGQRKNPESMVEIQEKNPKHVMNLCPSVCTEPGMKKALPSGSQLKLLANGESVRSSETTFFDHWQMFKQ